MNTHPFWSWFTANETKLRAINTLPENDRHELLCRFSKHLHNYSPEIGYRVIIPPENQGMPTIAFSSSRKPEVRALILNLMETAPRFKDWIITASITSLADQDPNYFENEYCLNGICCKPSHIKFWALLIDPNTDQFILGIFLDYPTDRYDLDLLREVVAIILTDTLGEERFEKHIENFIIHSDPPDDEVVFELHELRQYLEDY